MRRRVELRRKARSWRYTRGAIMHIVMMGTTTEKTRTQHTQGTDRKKKGKLAHIFETIVCETCEVGITCAPTSLVEISLPILAGARCSLSYLLIA